MIIKIVTDLTIFVMVNKKLLRTYWLVEPFNHLKKPALKYHYRIHI